MRTPAPVGEVESQSLNRALEGLREEWGFPSSYGLPELLKGWVKTVASLRKGYPLARTSFEHDVDLRDELDRIVGLVPERLGAEIQSFLAPVDAEFHERTAPQEEPLSEPLAGEFPSLRQFRRPKLLAPADQDVAATWR